MPLFPVVSNRDGDDSDDDEVHSGQSWQRSRTAQAAASAASAASAPPSSSSSSSRKREPTPHSTRAEESRSDGKRRRHRSPPPTKSTHTTTTHRSGPQASLPSSGAGTHTSGAGNDRARATAATSMAGAGASDAGWYVDSGGDGKNLQFESLYKGDVVLCVLTIPPPYPHCHPLPLAHVLTKHVLSHPLATIGPAAWTSHASVVSLILSNLCEILFAGSLNKS